MRMGIISILFCSCLLSLVSCEHKDLCYSHPHDQEVRILFDWSNIREENIPKVVAVVFRNEATNTVVEFALPPEGGIVMIPNGAYKFTAYNVGQYGNIFKETDAGKIVTTPVSRKLKGIYYETPDFLCLENLRVALTDSETSRLITAKPIRRTARVDYRINGIERLEKADAIYAVLSGCSAELELYTGCCVERHEDGIQHNIVFEVDKWKQQGWFYMFGCGFTPENRRTSEHVSGKSRALLPLSPLRTVRESFPSYGSSNSIFLFVVRNRLILSTVSFISLVAVVMDKLPYN